MNIIHKSTLKTLQRNKVRTLVTIIGIILSVAMFTAVTTTISSLQQYMIDVVSEMDGSWHGAVYSADSAAKQKLENNDKVKDTVEIHNLGYAKVNSKAESKPYIFVAGIEDNFNSLLPTTITSGRCPKNSSEIMLPKHLAQSGKVIYALGDTVKLDLGERTDNGAALKQTDVLTDTEQLNNTKSASFTVVGFYERPSFEAYNAPGFTAITKADSNSSSTSDLYFTVHHMKQVYSIIDSDFEKYSCSVNSDLLRFSGQSNEDNFMRVLYSMAAILMGIIMFGSISLIYNAFSISISERTKQFGLLKSIGATNRQIKNSVIFEGLSLCVIGVPLGLLSGIVGMLITFKFTGGMIDMLSNGNVTTNFQMHLSVMALLIAAAVGIVTVLISAYIPARRAVKMNAIEAIRQSQDISIKNNKVKTSKLTLKLFGFEGMLASKNFKRSKKKYRATVVSLFMSVVLFITASSFTSYMHLAVGTVSQSYDFDISYTADESVKNNESFAAEISSLPAVKKSGFTSSYTGMAMYTKEQINTEYYKFISGGENPYSEIVNGGAKLPTTLCFVMDSEYKKYLSNNGLSISEYMNPDSPLGVALVDNSIFNNDEQKFYNFNVLKESVHKSAIQYVPDKIDDYVLEEISEDGKTCYYKHGEDKKEYSYDSVVQNIDINIGSYTKKTPYCMARDNSSGSVTVMYPYSAAKLVLGGKTEHLYTTFYMTSSNPNISYDKLVEYLDSKSMPTNSIYNVAESAQVDNAMIGVVSVFSYGFIVLISLIAVANVFNTISTNINLRRREFAMLKSVGMTHKGFNKMMNFECLLYGFKGLAWGIPVALVLTFLMYRSLSGGIATAFYIPWYSIVIAVGSVFVVVFATMLYSMSKIKKENPIDTLKNENI